MRRRVLPVMLTVAALAAALPLETQAQAIPSPYRHIERAHAVSLFGGYLATDRGSLGIGPGSAPVYGIQYAGRFAAPVAGIVRLWSAPGERSIYSREDPSDPEAALTLIDETSATLMGGEVGLRLLITGPRTWHSLAPFVELTGGLFAVAGSRTPLEQDLPADQIVDYGTSFAGATTVGTDWFLTDRLSLNVGARAFLWRLTAPEGLTSTGREESEWTRNFGGSIGAAYHF